VKIKKEKRKEKDRVYILVCMFLQLVMIAVGASGNVLCKSFENTQRFQWTLHPSSGTIEVK